jgi:hypothetical protein
MLSDVISVTVMSNIFKSTDLKLSNASRQLYQNILQHYFSDKEEVIGNLNEFDIDYEYIPNYAKYSKQLTQLEEAKIIKLTTSKIVFLDKWSEHVQLHRMTKQHKMQLASDYKDEMYNSHQLIEAVAMKLRIKKQEVNQLLQLFFAEQDGIGKTYQNESECRKHFIYWCQNNINKIVKSSVKSNSKILGRNNDEKKR